MREIKPARLLGLALVPLALGGCGSLDGLTGTQGGLAGAGVGALAGAVASGGVIVPVLAATSGAILGQEMAEPGPVVGSGTPDAARVATASPGDLFARLDDDRNGWLDKTELEDSADVDRNWTRFDADDDGRISRDEFADRYKVEPRR